MRNDPLLGRRGTDETGGRGRRETVSLKRGWVALLAVGAVLLKFHFMMPLLIGIIPHGHRIPAWSSNGNTAPTRPAIQTNAEPSTSGPSAIAAANAYDPSEWITSDDYPAASMLAGEHGRVTIRWERLPNGHVGECRVVRSSGFARLDEAACHAVISRGRYAPMPGRAAPEWHTRRVVWMLPS